MPAPKWVINRGSDTKASGSDRKKLRQRVNDAYNLLSAEQLDALIPTGKADDVRLLKLGKRDDLVAANGQPVFLSLDGAVVPTVYSLYVAPQILRQVFVYPGVEKNICRGADLFLPGVVRPEGLEDAALRGGIPWPNLVFGGPFAKGDLCALVTAGGWAPFAVGRFALSSGDALEWGLAHGVGVAVLHHVGDELWEAGSRAKPPPEPPATAAAALAGHRQRAEAAAAAAAAASAAKRARDAAAAEALRVEGLGKRRRNVEKKLRQIEDVRRKNLGSSAAANADQQAKLAAEASLRAELAEITAEMEKLGAAAEDGEAEQCAEEREDFPEARGGLDALRPPPPPLPAAELLEGQAAEASGSAAAAESWEDIAAADEGPAVAAAAGGGGGGDGGGGDGGGGGGGGGGGASGVGGSSAGAAAAAAAGGENGAHVEGCEGSGNDPEKGNEDPGNNPGCEDPGNDAQNDPESGSEGDDAAAVDRRFAAAFFAALAEEQLPALANLVFAHAGAKLPRGGAVGIKQTSWKKAGRFLEAFQDCVRTKETRPGVVEILSFDAAAAPIFVAEDLPPEEEEEGDTAGGGTIARGGAAAAPVRATKKGGAVTVTVRKVRGKNVTFVDGLEGWGIDKDGMQSMARDFRRRFSASASVGERKGTEGGRKELWSLQIQGKYAEQLAAALRERGVTKVNVSAKAGILSKQDKTANV